MKRNLYALFVSLLIITSTKAQTLLSESFEGTVFPPSGWTLINAGNGNPWTQNTTSTYAYDGTKSMTYAYESTSTYAGNAWAITPAISVATGTTYYISFFVRARSSVYPESLKFTVGNGASVAAQTTTLKDSNNILNTTFRRWSVAYTPTTTGNVNFGFNCYSAADEYNLYVDSITIATFSACSGTVVGGTATASATTVCSSSSTNTVTLGVTGSTSTLNLTYQWQSSAAGANNWSNINTATSATYNATIAASTDYRRVTTCPASGSSATSAPVSVTVTSTPVTLVSPANNSTAVSNLFTLRWRAFTGATSYDVYIGTTNPPSLAATATDTAISFNSNTAGTTFYWYIAPKNSTGAAIGCPSSVYTFTTTTTPPANDSCGAPITLAIGTVTGTTTAATQSIAPDSCGGYTATGALDVWYAVTPVRNGSMTISVTGYSNFDAVMFIYTGNCGSLTRLGCSDGTGTGGLESITIPNAVAGTRYLVRVYAYTGTGGFNITSTGPALPVTGMTLSAIRSGKNVQLGWQTLTEANNAGFEVQRSADGSSFSSFLKVASKANGGNSTAAINYTAEDAKPFSGANYYRLKQTDKDGKVTYSNVVYLKGQAVSNLTLSAIYPNPTRDVLKAAVQAPGAETITFIVTDMMGKAVSRQTTQVISGDNTINLNVANLASGNYLLKAICANGCETAVQKFTKQ